MRVERRGRKAPANRKPRYCPDCHGTMVKCGRTSYSGRQMWKCRSCGTTTINPLRD